MLAVGLVATLAATGLPRLFMGGVTRSEATVRHDLSSFAAAQQTVYTVAGNYGSPRELAGVELFMGAVRGTDAIGKEWHNLKITSADGVVFENGYRVAAWLSDDRQRWAVVAWPGPSAIGKKAFLITQQGQVWNCADETLIKAFANRDVLATTAWGSPAGAVGPNNMNPLPPWLPSGF
jgi:type II secretory pathway pseudopilin PulG